LYKGFIRLLPKHYNTHAKKTGYKRVFSEISGDMIGFLIPAFDMEDPKAWAETFSL
jgi:hypothetical protein